MARLTTTLSYQQAEDLAQLFGALRDPSRLRILSTLLDGERSVLEITERTGLSQSAVSHQLRGLRQLHVVRARKHGRQVFYALHDQHVSDLFLRGFDHISHPK